MSSNLMERNAQMLVCCLSISIDGYSSSIFILKCTDAVLRLSRTCFVCAEFL